MTLSMLTDKSYWESEWSAEIKGVNRSQSEQLLSPLIDFLDSRQSEPLKVLEIGCCPGEMLRAISHCLPNASLSGVDICSGALESTAIFLDHESIQADLHCVSLEDFSPKDKFDVIFSIGLLEHFENPLSAIEKMLKLLSPRGIFFATVPQYNTWLQRRLIHVVDPGMWQAHDPLLMNELRFKQVMSKAGLTAIQSGIVGCPSLRSVRKQRGILATISQLGARSINYTFRNLRTKPIFGWGTAVFGLGIKST